MTVGTSCPAGQYFITQDPARDEIEDDFAFPVGCITPSSAVKANQEISARVSPRLVSLRPATRACGVFGHQALPSGYGREP